MAEKIFIDISEEIIFVVEKIKQTEKGQVILVVPERAALLGSVVNLRLLFAEITKTGKDVILVTKDAVGLKLANKADFVAVEEVNQISSETWDRAANLKKRFLDERNLRKQKLLKERKENDADMEGLVQDKKRGPFPGLKKMKPQKVNIEGFEMMAGGDIALEGSSKRKDIIQENSSNAMKPEAGKKKEGDRGSRLIGKDMSAFGYTSPVYAGRKEGRGSKDSSTSKLQQKFKGFISAGLMRKKFIFIAGIVSVGLFAFFYFVLPSVRIVVEVESQDIEFEKEIVADTAIVTLDIESLTIPAEVVESLKDRSDTMDATGVKQTGEVAGGQVTLFNRTENEITVRSGTVLEYIERGLKYKITGSDVTIPAQKPDDDSEKPGLIGSTDVGIMAESFGEDFNIEKKVEFRVEGFDVEDLYGKNFNNVTGGTTEEQKVVSQSDYDTLKADLEDTLKQDAMLNLQEIVGESGELLEDTVNYEIVSESASPGVGAEADTFSLSLNLKATALSFAEEHISELASKLAEDENEEGVEVEEFEYSAEVTKIEGNKIYIILQVTGVVTPSIDEDSLKAELCNKTISGAEKCFEDKGEIKDFRIEFSPSWFPKFFRRFPRSAAKIEIKIEKV